MLILLRSPNFQTTFRAQSYLSHETSFFRPNLLIFSCLRSYSLKHIYSVVSKNTTISRSHSDTYNKRYGFLSPRESILYGSRRMSSSVSYGKNGRPSRMRNEEITDFQSAESEFDPDLSEEQSSESLNSPFDFDSSCPQLSLPDPSSFDPPEWSMSQESDESDIVLFSSSKNTLPVSPLMDEDFYRARGKYRQTKKRPPEKLSEMQLAIRKNPYAWALTTPVRKCRLTGIALPRFFLLDFCAIEDPKTGVAWYMPRGLSKRRLLSPVALEKALPGQYHLPLSNIDEIIQNSELDSAAEEAKSLENPGQSDNSTSLVESKSLPPLAPRIGGGTYLLRSYDAIQTFLNMSSKASSGLFITQTMRNNPLALEAHRKAKLRPDMAEFVLTLKRRRVMEWLILVTSRSKGYLSQFIPTKTLKTRQAAAVILIGPPLTRPTGNVLTEQDFYEFLEKKPSHVPVFDLRVLLGEEMLQQLKSSDPKRWKSEVLVLKSRNFTMPILTSLWELEGYQTPLLNPS